MPLIDHPTVSDPGTPGGDANLQESTTSISIMIVFSWLRRLHETASRGDNGRDGHSRSSPDYLGGFRYIVKRRSSAVASNLGSTPFSSLTSGTIVFRTPIPRASTYP